MERLPTNWNRHHVLYQGREYRRNLVLGRLRSHPGLILPIFIPDHRALHRTLYTSVPRPDLEATKYFLESVVLYSPDQPRTRTLDQAIDWFATCSEPTAEHLAAQREFILKTLLEGEDSGSAA